jgi:hypothetical protein
MPCQFLHSRKCGTGIGLFVAQPSSSRGSGRVKAIRGGGGGGGGGVGVGALAARAALSALF